MDICLTRPIRHGGERLHSVPPPPWRWQYRPLGINLGTYNIWYGRGFGLPQAIHYFKGGNYNPMLFMEINIMYTVYCHNRLNYDVICSKATVTAAGGFQRGGGLVSQERPEVWIVESTRFYRSNVVSCEVVSGDQKMSLIGSYLPL